MYHGQTGEDIFLDTRDVFCLSGQPSDTPRDRFPPVEGGFHFGSSLRYLLSGSSDIAGNNL